MTDFRAWKEKYFGYPKRDDSCAREKYEDVMMRDGEITLKYNISSNLTLVHENSRGVPSTSPSATVRGVKYKSPHCPHQRSKIYTTCIGFPEGINLREELQVACGHAQTDTGTPPARWQLPESNLSNVLH